MMYSLAISLPESSLVQSPLRLSACAHTHVHTRTRASSDARLAATRGAGRCSRRTRYQHGCGSDCLTRAAREVGSDSDFQVWGSSDDIALPRQLAELAEGWQMAPAFIYCTGSRVTARAVSSSVNDKGRDSLHEVDVPYRLCVCTRRGTRHVTRARHSRVSLPNCPWQQSFEKKNLGLTAASLRWRAESCIRECEQRVRVEV